MCTYSDTYVDVQIIFLLHGIFDISLIYQGLVKRTHRENTIKMKNLKLEMSFCNFEMEVNVEHLHNSMLDAVGLTSWMTSPCIICVLVWSCDDFSSSTTTSHFTSIASLSILNNLLTSFSISGISVCCSDKPIPIYYFKKSEISSLFHKCYEYISMKALMTLIWPFETL